MNEFFIENKDLKVAVSAKGGELQSIQGKDHTEYLWQGDPKFWHDRSPVLFPFIGRLWNKTYEMDGKSYEMGIHGFFRDMELTVKDQKPDSVTLAMTDTPETYARYPRHFEAAITYALSGSCLEVTFRVENRDEKAMHFAYGGHPGFNLPMKPGMKFEDYYLEFSREASPLRIGLSDQALVQPPHSPYALEGGKRLALRHGLFDHDAVILKDMDRTVTIKTDRDDRAITVSFPQMPYVGFWHMSGVEAPYLCIEPWSALPGRQDVTERFEEKEDLVHLPAGQVYENHWRIEIHQ